MQTQFNREDKRTPAREINPLNTDFKPGGEEEKWPEDPQAEEYLEKDDSPEVNRNRPGSDEELFEDEEWERVIRDYKIY